MAFSSVSVVANSLRLRRGSLAPGDEAAEDEAAERNLRADVTDTHKKMNDTMERTMRFKVDGMMCNHCRMHVEQALNSVAGVQASVTLEPPVATVRCADDAVTAEQLQRAVAERAGDYRLTEL
jgi:Cu2+-exporting ATPase